MRLAEAVGALAKCLTRILFLPKRNGGYWSDQGYERYAAAATFGQPGT